MIVGRDLGRAVLAAVVASSLGASVAAAQALRPRVYVLNVPLGAAEGTWSPSGATHLTRIRAFAQPRVGPVTIDAAYEHTLRVRLAGSATLGPAVGTSGAGGEWLPLQGTLLDRDRVQWRHRLDRLAVRVASGAVEATVGRQTISWATTLLFTPGDPFQPFDPADPFRTYRGGVDAVRIRVFTGAFSSIEGVGRLAAGRSVTALGRWASEWGVIGASGWGGIVHDRAAGSVGLTLTAAGAILRGEASVRATDDDPVWRVAVGVDRGFVVADRTLYVSLEYRHDDFGARNPGELPLVLVSDAALRGELQGFGRDAGALTLSYAVHPLVTVDLVALANLRDPSVLAAPAATISVGDESALRLGSYLGVGRNQWDEGSSTVPLPGSEYGPVPLIVYAALEMFF